MRVEEAMTPRSELVTATVPGSREDVLRILQERSFSSVPIVRETEDGDVFRGLISRERLIEEPDEEQISMLLEAVEPIHPSASIGELANHMLETGARRVPVVDGGLSGIITITDVVAAIAGGAVDVDATVGSVAGRAVHTVFEETPILAAERSIYYGDVNYAVVIDAAGDMTGIVTEADIVDVAEVVEGEEGTGDSIANQDSEWAWEGIKGVGNRMLPTRNVEFPDDPVATIMSDDVVTISRRRTVAEAAQEMVRHDVEQVPVIAGGKLAGILCDMHLLEAFDG